MMSVLGILKNEMTIIDVPYEHMRWTSPVSGAYVVSEYSESPIIAEDGGENHTILLTATTRGSWLELEQIREKIKKHFPPIYGKGFTTNDGVVVFYYGNGFPVETGEADLKRIQINLEVKKWRTAQ